MSLPDHVAAILSPGVRRLWGPVAAAVPQEAYLVGGTAVAAHLGHRESRDFDFFLERAVDLDAVGRSLAAVGALAVTARDDATLNTVLDDTVVQLLDASTQRVVEPTVDIAGMRVAGIGDLLATKLHAVVSRPALRDYVDLMAIEERANRFVEEGLGVYVERYGPRVPDEAVAAVVRALAAFEDVPPDPTLDVSKEDVASHWMRRIRDITRNLGRWG